MNASGIEWTWDLDTVVALFELVGSPTPFDGDRRPDHADGVM
jgi:hypothetical protein